MRLTVVSVNSVLALAMFACSPHRSGAIEPLVSTYGIGTVLHPVQEPTNTPPEDARVQAAKDHVHIFAVNGLNPLCLGNFNGLCVYLKKQGYSHTYFGQMYTCYNFANRAREIRHSDPEAKIVLIGFSLGANLVRTISNDLAKDGTTVDLLVYLVGDTISNSPESRPENVKRVVNVRAKGLVLTGGDLFLNGADIDGARNEKINVRHILIPSRRQTLDLLNEELHMLVTAQAGPVATPLAPPLTPSQPPPTSPPAIINPTGTTSTSRYRPARPMDRPGFSD